MPDDCDGLSGEEYYATPTGAGRRDGSSWEDAVGGASLSSFIDDEMRGGDVLSIGSGEYQTGFAVPKSGTDGEPVVVRGVDRGRGIPVFRGSWSADDGEDESAGIRLAADASAVVIRNLALESWGVGLGTESGAVNRDVRIEDLEIRNVYRGLCLRDVRDSVVSNCEVIRHQNRGVRLEEGCRDLEVLDCHTDHNEGDYDWPQDWPFGYAVENGRSPADQRDVTFRRCEARHCQQVLEGRYWNGDGFVVENEHPGVEFYDCVAYANQDGGWDDKGVGSYYENCVSVNNGRNFRSWGSAEYHNCLSVRPRVRGGVSTSCGLWSEGETELYNCTFADNGDHAVEKTVARAERCLFTGGDPSIAAGEGNVFDADPNFRAPDPAYDGHPRDAYDSLAHGPDVGYWHRE